MKMYVGNLPYSVTEDDLRNMFTEFGDVDDVTIIKDRETGRAKGFGFVEMSNDSEANQAMEALNDKELNGRNIKVNKAKPRENRPRRHNRY